MNIGFIGLGVMGRPMAENLIDAGQSSKRVGPASSYGSAGGVSPRWIQAGGVAIRPRGVRARKPLRTRKGSATSSTVSRSSPTATASLHDDQSATAQDRVR